MENIQMLEEKISKVVDKIKSVTEENNLLNTKIAELHEELNKKDVELKAARAEHNNTASLKKDIDKLNSEREIVKTQVEDLIKELESVEM